MFGVTNKTMNIGRVWEILVGAGMMHYTTSKSQKTTGIHISQKVHTTAGNIICFINLIGTYPIRPLDQWFPTRGGGGGPPVVHHHHHG